MKVFDFTELKAFQVLATQSRRIDIGANELCRLHTEMGKMLGYQMMEEFSLREIKIQHPQGTRTGVEIRDEDKIVILALMRAGLYAAQGVREAFPKSSLRLLGKNWKREIENIDFEGKIPVVVDSVINTGATVDSVLEELQGKGCEKGFVATLVLQQDAVQKLFRHHFFTMFAFRVSQNRYIGKGGTDTGNRLFNTI